MSSRFPCQRWRRGREGREGPTRRVYASGGDCVCFGFWVRRGRHSVLARLWRASEFDGDIADSFSFDTDLSSVLLNVSLTRLHYTISIQKSNFSFIFFARPRSPRFELGSDQVLGSTWLACT